MNEQEFDQVTPDGKRYYEYVDAETGDVMRVYEKSGVTYNVTRKHLATGYFSKKNAKEMQLRGAEQKKINYVESARRGLLRGVKATTLASDHGIAWEYIVAAQAELALAVDMGNASTRAAEFIAKVADLNPRQHGMSISDGKNSLELSNVDTDTLNDILRRL